MKIGRLGEVNFEVSGDAIKTLCDLSITLSARKQTHERHAMKGVVEFGGADPATVEFKMLLSRYLGADVRTDYETLRTYIESGRTLMLTLGGRTCGDYRWLITKLKASAQHFDRRGEIVTMEVSVSLIEYLKR